MTRSRRARGHRRAAEWLEGVGGRDVSALAHHWSQAAGADAAGRAARWSVEAGREAMARLAPIEAASQFAAALQYDARPGSGAFTPDERVPALSLGARLSDLPTGSPYVLTLLAPYPDLPFDQP